MKQEKRDKNYYIWACDFSKSSGEGILAREFICFFIKKKNISNIKIETPNAYFKFKGNKFQKYKKKFYLKNSLFNKYITPFVGVINLYININFFKSKTIYINFLPIWNFILFLIMPSKTYIGPITGSDYYSSTNNFNNKIRKLFFPSFNFISKLIIRNKNKLIFSTNLVDYNYSNSIKNFQLIYFLNRKKSKKKLKKKIDYLFYYRNHPNKNQNNIFKFLKIMRDNGRVIKICGDKHDDFKAENLGFLEQKKLNKTLAETKFVIASNENPISFFIQQALLQNVSIIFDNHNSSLVRKYYENYNLLNFSLLKYSNYQKIKLKIKKFKKNNFKKQILNNLSKNLLDFN